MLAYSPSMNGAGLLTEYEWHGPKASLLPPLLLLSISSVPTHHRRGRHGRACRELAACHAHYTT